MALSRPRLRNSAGSISYTTTDCGCLTITAWQIWRAKKGIPRIVSTRGMLEPWALDHKRVKKRVAWHLYQKRDLMAAHRFHATSAAEARNVAKLGLNVPVDVVPNGVDLPAAVPAREERQDNRSKNVALFLGRIYPVKGLPMLIEAWAKVRPQGWELHIAGPDENGHRSEVEAAVARNGLTDAVRFLGLVQGGDVAKVYGSADLFVLPSHSESFGMSIAEALAHSLPVLTTTAAPWPDIPRRGCGWWAEPSVDAIADALRQATSGGRDILQTMGAKGREYVAEEFSWPAAGRAMVDCYRTCLAMPCLTAERAYA